jgi:hypothetical protein
MTHLMGKIRPQSSSQANIIELSTPRQYCEHREFFYYVFSVVTPTVRASSQKDSPRETLAITDMLTRERGSYSVYLSIDNAVLGGWYGFTLAKGEY